MPFIKRALLGALIFFTSLNSLLAEPTPNFQGQTIRVGVMDASAIGAPATVHARSWEQRTGGRVNVDKFAFQDLFKTFNQAIQDKTPAFDVIFYAPAWAGDFADHLQPVPLALRDAEHFIDIHPTYRDRLMHWGDEMIAVTVDGDLFLGYYRTDLFANRKNRIDFKSRYGYPLAPPATWRHYRDIAEFFTGRQRPNGHQLYGVAEAFKRGGQQFWDLFSRAAAYTNAPEQPGGQFFDPETMQAQINNPGWVQATTDYKEALSFAPPHAIDFGIVEARKAFLSGQTAMILDWADTATLAPDEKNSQVAGRVGYFTLPGADRVWNGRWKTYTPPHQTTFLAFGGWVASVPKNSQAKQAAWDYIMWYASPENSLADVVTSGTGINPYRESHFIAIDRWLGTLSLPSASNFLGVIQQSLDAPHVALDLRLPGFHQYTEALETELDTILRGKQPIQAGLDRVAQQWEIITDKLGRDKQRQHYRSSMGLSNSEGEEP
ncbi:extracellular solute-binding protein [Magnetococcus sp. PR-3]|uniref:extracellular solute-binding protein n=1 Tax=Magnetococcus sp. PR-3 TaxID=3120355 RepID=UPI002FCE6030